MKKFHLLIVAVCISITAGATTVSPRDLLNGLGGNSGSQSGQTGGNSNPLGSLGSFINNSLANSNFEIADLQGTWNYTSPAVSFKSDNFLQNIGGAAGATALENQLEPYYTRLRFNNSSLEVDSLDNFTLKLGSIPLKGKIEKDENNQLVFNFSAMNRIPLGKVSANATKAGNTLNITFEATRLIAILNKISSMLNVSSLQAVTSLLNSYEGVYIGFKMQKQ